MLFPVGSILGVLAVCTSVVAHGQVSGIVAGGLYYPGYLPQSGYQKSPPNVAGWSIPQDILNGPVYPASYNNPDIICHIGATPGAASVKVAAGQTVELQWTPWPVTHHGPVIDYLANCNGPCSEVDKTRLRFNKVDATGLLRESHAAGQAGFWAADRLREANNSWTMTVPSTIAAGNYVLRHEIIALHDAIKINGAQNYPHCINLEVTGSGSDKLASGTLGTNLYRANDPGIKIDIYKPLIYHMPGPPIHRAASLAPVQEGNYGSTAMKASEMKEPAVPEVLNNVQPEYAPKAQALNPSLQPQTSTLNTTNNNTITPNNTDPSLSHNPTTQDLNTTPSDPNAAAAASLPPQQPNLAPVVSPSTPSTPPGPSTPSPKKKQKKPCNRPPNPSTSPSPSQPQTSVPPSPSQSVPSSPPKKKLKKKPCTKRRPTTGFSTSVPQAQNAPAEQSSPPPTVPMGTKKLKKKPCKRRRRRNSEL